MERRGCRISAFSSRTFEPEQTTKTTIIIGLPWFPKRNVAGLFYILLCRSKVACPNKSFIEGNIGKLKIFKGRILL